ncbi:MAG: hypothetical protein WAO58_11635 [Fimbriimonadaceae bacterium]
MPPLEELVGGFLITGASIIVVGLTVLLIIYKMLEGGFETIPGIVAITACLVLLAIAIRPPHPMLPALVLIVIISLVAFFPFAETMLEKAAMQGIDTDQLEKSYAALRARPDNAAAKLAIAKMLHTHGMREHAIAVASTALGTLSAEIDPLQNRSIRDLFYNEAIALKRWQMEAANAPKTLPNVVKCISCGRENLIGDILCAGCGRPYLLDTARSENLEGKMAGRLLLGWAAIAALFVGSASLALMFSGFVRMVLFVSAFAAAAAFLAWLFKPPKRA